MKHQKLPSRCELIQLIADGKTPREIAAMYGASRQRVYKALATELGPPGRPSTQTSPCKWLVPLGQRFCDVRKANLRTQAEVASVAGCPPAIVCRLERGWPISVVHFIEIVKAIEIGDLPMMFRGVTAPQNPKARRTPRAPISVAFATLGSLGLHPADAVRWMTRRERFAPTGLPTIGWGLTESPPARNAMNRAIGWAVQAARQKAPLSREVLAALTLGPLRQIDLPRPGDITALESHHLGIAASTFWAIADVLRENGTIATLCNRLPDHAFTGNSMLTLANWQEAMSDWHWERLDAIYCALQKRDHNRQKSY